MASDAKEMKQYISETIAVGRTFAEEERDLLWSIPTRLRHFEKWYVDRSRQRGLTRYLTQKNIRKSLGISSEKLSLLGRLLKLPRPIGIVNDDPIYAVNDIHDWLKRLAFYDPRVDRDRMYRLMGEKGVAVRGKE